MELDCLRLRQSNTTAPAASTIAALHSTMPLTGASCPGAHRQAALRSAARLRSRSTRRSCAPRRCPWITNAARRLSRSDLCSCALRIRAWMTTTAAKFRSRRALRRPAVRSVAHVRLDQADGVLLLHLLLCPEACCRIVVQDGRRLDTERLGAERLTEPRMQPPGCRQAAARRSLRFRLLLLLSLLSLLSLLCGIGRELSVQLWLKKWMGEQGVRRRPVSGAGREARGGDLRQRHGKLAAFAERRRRADQVKVRRRVAIRVIAFGALEQNNPERPQVGGTTILLTLDAFRRHVRRSAHKGFSGRVAFELLRDAKVGEGGDARGGVQQNVGRLEVAM
eukprot:7282510-Prymnesium_polylepis.1